MAEALESLDVSDLKENFLECPVCLEHFDQAERRPRLLVSCLHAFCTQCLEQLLKKEGRGQVTCPNCRHVQKVNGNAQSLPVDPVRNKLVDYVQFKKDKKIPCTDCPDGSHAVARCHECQSYMCIRCKEAHQRNRSTRKHTCRSLEEALSEPVKNFLSHFCKDHPDHKIEFYCRKCSSLCCVSCSIVKHKGHDLDPIEDAANSMLSSLKNKMEDVAKSASVLRRKGTLVEQETDQHVLNLNQTTLLINQTFEEFNRKLKLRQNKLITELQERTESTVNSLKKQHQATEDSLAQMESALEYFKQMETKSDDCEVLSAGPVLVQSLEAVAAVDQTQDVQHPTWTFSPGEMNTIKVNTFGEVHVMPIYIHDKMKSANSLEKMRKTIQAKCDRRKTIVERKMKIYPCQLMLLVKQGVMDRFSLVELKLIFNFETGEITITGQQEDVDKVRSDIWEEVNKIKVETVVSHFTSGELEFLRRENVRRYLQKQSEERSASVAGCWERGTEGLKVFFLTEEGLEDVKHFLKASVKETTHRLDQENASLLKSSKYKNLIDQLNVEYEQRLTVKSDKRQIVITTVSSEAGAVVGQISRFLEMNCIYDKLFEGDGMKIKFVNIHCKDRVKKLETDLKDFLVSIEISDGPEYTIRVKSTKDGCPLAERELRQIVREVKCHKRELERPGLKEFLKSEDVLQQIERDIRCVIGFDDGTNFEDDDVYDVPDFSHSIPFECQFDRDRKLHVVVGEMISLASEVDAVVVEVTPKLCCDSRQSWEVIQKAGDKPAQELHRYTGGQDIMEGEVFCTSPGNLRCTHLIHAVGPSSSVGQRDTIVSVVAESMQEAAKNNLGSVALPSFCTESVISAQDALRAVVDGVHVFYTQTRNSSITDTYLGLETWDNCESLWDIAVDVFGSENIRSNEEMSTGDSLHGGNRRGMGLRKEIKMERTEELDAYRAQRGYIEKYGGAMSKVLKTARSTLKTKKRAQVPSKPLAKPAKPAQPARNFNRLGTLQRSQLVSKPKKVSLFLYTDDEFEVSKALNKICNSWDKKSLSRDIQDETIKQWTNQQIQELTDIENKHSVSIKVVKSQGQIKVFGLKANVPDAIEDIINRIRTN